MNKKSWTKEDSFFVSVKICNDSEIKKLNKKYLGKDKVTDVLSFEINEQSEDGFYLGDVVVNKDQAKRQSGEYGNNLEQEIAELVKHGTLHLLGVHHKGDDR